MIYDKHNKNMKLNIDDFYAGLNDIISFDHSNNDKCCKKAIRCLLSNYPNLDQPVRFLFRDKGTTSKHLCRIADALIVIYKHSFIDDTKDKISDLIIGCYARSFILAPFRERHKIAFDLCCYISLTYYTYYTSGSIKVTNYSSHLEDYFSYFSMKDCDPECNKIYKTYLYKTSDGKAYCYSGQRVAKLMQWYILQHIKNVNEINQNILGVDSSKIQNEIDECYSHLCNIEKHKIKKLGYGLFYFLLCDYSDEDNFMIIKSSNTTVKDKTNIPSSGIGLESQNDLLNVLNKAEKKLDNSIAFSETDSIFSIEVRISKNLVRRNENV